MIMSKTKRTSKLYRERQTAIQLEKMEPRQLLATVTGGGEEVGSDISYQGNVYDQVLMQGAAVSVEADPGQIVRVSWIDGNGDITQGEFSGSGTFTVSLDNFGAPAEPENYNQPGVEYASGHASITIEGSSSSSNVSVFTVGPTTSHNFGALDTGVDLDGVADIARITIVADPSQPGGSTFGGIRTANAMYSDDTGVVGIAADGVQVQTVVLIGDIDASNSGIPTLLFGDNSQFGTVQVAGGDLAQSNGEAINDGGFQTVSFIDGMTSDGVLQPAGTFLGAFSSGEQRITALDTSTEINIEGMSQAELDATFAGKTFTEDLTIVGDLEQYQRISAGEFQKSITFDGDYAGSITVGTVGGDITFMGTESGRTISSNITAGSLGGSLIFGSDTSAANYTGTLRTSSMAAETIQVFGDFKGTVTTDGDNDGSFDVGEGALGDISVSGDFSGNAVGILGIGNITVGGNLTSEGGAVFYTSSNDAPDGAGVGAIGTLTVMGDVDQDDGDMLINIANNGSFGAITLMGGGTAVGLISIGGSQLGTSNGDISITGSYHVNVDGIDVNAGSLGHITITGIAGTGVAGDKNEVSTLTLGNVVAGSSIGNVSISGSDRLSLDDIMTRTAGMLDFSANMSIAADGAITASHQLGSITFTGSTSINADITSAWMGDVMIDGNATFADGMGLVSGDRADAGDKAAASTGRLTSFEVTGNTTFDSTSGANIELATGGDFTFGGMVTGTASGTEIVASSLGDFSFSGALGSDQALVTDLTVRATPGDGDKVAKDGSKATDGTNLSDYSIGNISVESTNTIGIPGASLFAGNNVFHALGAIGDISLLGGGSPNAQTPLFSTDTDSLLLIVGDTTGDPTSAPTIDFDGDGTNDTFADIIKSTVSIGNVSINVGPDSSNYNSFVGAGDPDATAEARFTGMNILSGVYAASADQINAVHDRFDSDSDKALRSTYTTAKDNLDTLLGDRDSTALLAAVDAAKAKLGAATMEDNADTDEDESATATGTYIAIEAAEAELDKAEKAREEILVLFNAAGTDAAEIIRLKGLLGSPSVDADPTATPPIDAVEATFAYGDYEEAQETRAGSINTANDGYSNNAAVEAVTAAQSALAEGIIALANAETELTTSEKELVEAIEALAADPGNPTLVTAVTTAQDDLGVPFIAAAEVDDPDTDRDETQPRAATERYETRDTARTNLGVPAGVLADDPLTEDTNENEEGTGLYQDLFEAQNAEDLVTAATTRDDLIAAAETLFSEAQAIFLAAQTAYLTAVENAGDTTVEDLNEATKPVIAAQAKLDAAMGEMEAAETELAAAESALPEGYSILSAAYEEARAALQAVGGQILGADEILMANDADLKGTIGNVNIQNMTTLLTTNAVADITDDLSITIESASGIVGATSVGSLDESKAGMIIGGDDSSLDEDELLVYIV